MRLQFRIMTYNDKQKQIIDTAEKLFAGKGYHGTSVRDIAEEAGVNIAMISYYFGSKEKLMQALFQERTSHLELRVERLLQNETLTPLEKVWTLVDEYVEKIVQRRQFYKIMVCEQMMDKNPVITGMINEAKKANADLIGRLIKDGQKKGAFKKNVDVVLMLNTMIGTVMQTFINQAYYKSYHKLEELSQSEFHQLLQKKLTNHVKSLFKAILSYEA